MVRIRTVCFLCLSVDAFCDSEHTLEVLWHLVTLQLQQLLLPFLVLPGSLVGTMLPCVQSVYVCVLP